MLHKHLEEGVTARKMGSWIGVAIVTTIGLGVVAAIAAGFILLIGSWF